MKLIGYCLWLWAAATCVGCDDVACDPDQINTGEFCVAAPADHGMPDGGATGAAGAPDSAGAGANAFGASCSDASECPAPTDWCAVQPPDTTGFCTRQGCLDDPSICPDEWSCMDLSVFSPTLPAICTPP